MAGSVSSPGCVLRLLKVTLQSGGAPWTATRAISTTTRNDNAFKYDPVKDKDLLLRETDSKTGVTLLTMNNPKKLNGWTGPMMMAVRITMAELAKDPNTKVTVLTGADPYYCAGVNFGDAIRAGNPAKLHKMVKENNAAIFNAFIQFPKPLIIAVNGPAIGACVTSATVCDAIVASEKATFATPFAKLGVPPEGCSSVHFERLMGKSNAERMLGSEGWVPSAAEAKEVGLITEVVKHEELVPRAMALAKEWADKDKPKNFAQGLGTVEEYVKVNWEESHRLADALFSSKFLDQQHRFFKSKGKDQLANMFLTLKLTRPLWSFLLPSSKPKRPIWVDPGCKL